MDQPVKSNGKPAQENKPRRNNLIVTETFLTTGQIKKKKKNQSIGYLRRQASSKNYLKQQETYIGSKELIKVKRNLDQSDRNTNYKFQKQFYQGIKIPGQTTNIN